VSAMAQRRAVFFIGLAVAAVAGVKLYVTGFYPSELWWVLPVLAVGALVMWISTRMPSAG
jgi:hypothetical protein